MRYVIAFSIDCAIVAHHLLQEKLPLFSCKYKMEKYTTEEVEDSGLTESGGRSFPLVRAKEARPAPMHQKGRGPVRISQKTLRKIA
jgi:hypothetical protein